MKQLLLRRGRHRVAAAAVIQRAGAQAVAAGLTPSGDDIFARRSERDLYIGGEGMAAMKSSTIDLSGI